MSNGSSFCTGSDDSNCRIFDTRSYSCLGFYSEEKIVCGITSVSMSKGGRILFSAYDDSNCIPWDVAKGSRTAVKDMSHENRISCVGVSVCGQAVATGSWDLLLKVRDSVANRFV